MIQERAETNLWVLSYVDLSERDSQQSHILRWILTNCRLHRHCGNFGHSLSTTNQPSGCVQDVPPDIILNQSKYDYNVEAVDIGCRHNIQADARHWELSHLGGKLIECWDNIEHWNEELLYHTWNVWNGSVERRGGVWLGGCGREWEYLTILPAAQLLLRNHELAQRAGRVFQIFRKCLSGSTLWQTLPDWSKLN